MRGSAVMHFENNHEGIVAHTSGVIALLPVGQQAAIEPENTYPGSASLVPRTASSRLSPGFGDTGQDSLTYLHHQHARLSHHKNGSSARSLRNLACRRARYSDVIGQRNVNVVLEEQFRTGDPKAAVRSGPVQPQEPTVRVERLELEVHRYGRIVPASNGSYHVLDTTEPENSSDGSTNSFRVDGEVIRSCGVMDRVGSEADHLDGAIDHTNGANDVTHRSELAGDYYDCAMGLDGADGHLQVEKTTSVSCPRKHRFKNSTHEYRNLAGDLTINAGNSSSNNSSGNAGLVNLSIQNDAGKGWQPVYEYISDPDSDADSTGGTKLSKKRQDELVPTTHANVGCRRSSKYAGPDGQGDVTNHKPGAVNKRRRSSPDDFAKRRKKEEKRKESHRRWSFNSDSEISQTDHKEAVKKFYLSKSLHPKDAKVESWNVLIDITRDEHTVEEFQFPVTPLPGNMVLKEEKEDKEEKEGTAISEENSSCRVDSALESIQIIEQSNSGDRSSSERTVEMNIEDEDTIEAPRGCFSVPRDEVNGTCSSTNMEEQRSCLSNETLSDPGDRTPIPESAHNNSVIICARNTRNETEGNYKVPSERPGPENDDAAVITEPAADSTVILSDDRSNLQALKAMDVLERLSSGTCVVAIAKDEKETRVASDTDKQCRAHCAYHGDDGCRNNVLGMGRRRPSQEDRSAAASDDASGKVEYGDCREEASEASSKYPLSEKSLLGCSHDPEERNYLAHKQDCSNLKTDTEKMPRNVETHPSKVSSGNDGYLKEDEKCNIDSNKELQIDENADRFPHQAHTKYAAGVQTASENTAAENEKDRQSHELMNKNGGCYPSKMTKRRRKKVRFTGIDKPQHELDKEASDRGSKIHKKPRGPRKPRHSRRSFRHDSIEMFKVSTAFPPHTTPVPWRYKCKKPESTNPVDITSVNPPSPVLNPNPTQSRLDDSTTNIEIEDDIPSPGSLTIDLGEQNTNSSETSNVEEDERSRKTANNDASGREDVLSPLRERRKSSEADSLEVKEKPSHGASPDSVHERRQSGELDSESGDEGQSKKQRKRAKKKKSGDPTVAADAMQRLLTAQMQEKGRRLAQELPGFNWLEEKIRNGGVTTVLPPKRPLIGATHSRSNCGSSLHSSNSGARTVPTSEALGSTPSHEDPKSVMDAARNNVVPPLKSPPEYRDSTRLQECLTRPPKRARLTSPTPTSELGHLTQEVVSPLQSKHQQVEAPSVPPAPIQPQQRIAYPQLHSPRQIQPPCIELEQEYSPHQQQQSSRRPVIVSSSELPKSSDVSPLLQQLTSGGELEVTLSTPPTSSSASSDSGVSTWSHKTTSDAEQPEVMHVTVKPVPVALTSARKGLQPTEERPRDVPPAFCTPCRRISYGMEPHQPESSSFPLPEHIAVYEWNRELPRWQGDVPPRKIPESMTGNPETVLPPPPYSNPDRAYSDRIATMARHAAMSFDTGFGMGLATSQEAGHRVLRQPQQRPADSTHQPSNCQREEMLKSSGYMPPLIQQPGTYDSRLPQHGLYHPSYMAPQQPIKPQVVRPCAQYPAGVGPYHPPPPYFAATAAACNSQGLMPGIPHYSNSLTGPQPSMLSPHAPRRERDLSVVPTNPAVLSTTSSCVQGTTTKVPQVPSPTQNQALTSCPQNQTQASDHQNQTQASDHQNKTQASDHQNQTQASDHQNQTQVSDHQNQSKASDNQNQTQASNHQNQTQASDHNQMQAPDDQNQTQASDHQNQTQDFDSLTKDKNTPKDIEEIRKAAEAAAEELEKLEQLKQTTKKNLQRLKLAQEQAMEELARTQKQLKEAVVAQKTGKAIQERLAVPSDIAATTQSSIPNLHVTLPTVAHKRHESPVLQDNIQSAQRPSNASDASGSSVPALADKQETNESVVASEKHQSAVSSEKNQSAVSSEKNQSVVSSEENQSVIASEENQSSVASQNHQSAVAHENQQSSIAHENNNHSQGAWENEQSAVTCENHQSGITRENHLTQQKLSLTSDGTESSVLALKITFSAVAQDNQRSRFSHKNHQAQQQPSGTGSSLHPAIPVVAHENCLTQEKLTFPSDNTGSSVPGLNTAFSADAQESQHSGTAQKNQQSRDACEDYQSAVTSENHQPAQTLSATPDASRSSVPGLHMKHATVACEKHHSEQWSSATVSMTRNSLPTGHQNQEPVQRPLPPSPPLLAQPPLPVPVLTPQQPPPTQILSVSHQVSHSHSRSTSHLHTNSVALPSHSVSIAQRPQHSQPMSVAHPPFPTLHPKPHPLSRPPVHLQLSYMPRPPPYSQMLPVPQTVLQSQSFPISQTSPHSHSLPSSVSQHSHSFPMSQTSPHSQTLPMPQTSPLSQTTVLAQTSPHSQRELVSQLPLHHQPLRVSEHSQSGIQQLQHMRSTSNIPQASVEVMATLNKAMPPPPLRQHHILSKPPQSSGPNTPVSAHSRCISPQAAPVPITVHSRPSPSHMTVIPRGNSMHQSSVRTEEPPVLHQAVNTSSSTCDGSSSSTVEEHPIDLSISKHKSPSKDKIKPPVLPVHQHNKHDTPGQSSTFSRHQDRPQNQRSVVHDPNPEEHNVADPCGILYRDHRMPQSHIPQHISAQNSRPQQHLPTSVQTGNKRLAPSHAESVPTESLATENDGSGRRHHIRPTSISGSAEGHKYFETAHHQNSDNGNVLHRQHLHAPAHHGMVHYSHHAVQSVCQCHTCRPIPGSSCIPVHNETVPRDPQSVQQQHQRHHTAKPHTASDVVSERDRYSSAIKQVLPTAASTPDQSSQDAQSVEGDLCQPHLQLVCGRCKQTARFMCSACHNEWYCSSDCQLRHWSYHSVNCHRQQENEYK